MTLSFSSLSDSFLIGFPDLCYKGIVRDENSERSLVKCINSIGKTRVEIIKNIFIVIFFL